MNAVFYENTILDAGVDVVIETFLIKNLDSDIVLETMINTDF